MAGISHLSTRAREAIKVGIAIVIGYYVALQLDWLSPTWVAISIAFISLPTAGQSLAKGFQRMGGTILAFVVGLFYLGLFPQDRWPFILSITPYLFFVAYMVTGKKNQYFWFVAGFVTLMITTAGPGSSEHAFYFAAYRALETMIGIVIWTLVSLFIWPRSNLGELKLLTHDLMSRNRDLVRRYRTRMTGVGTDDDGEGDEGEPLQVIRDQAGRLTVQLEQTINAAAAESYEVYEVRKLWQRLSALSLSAIEVLDRIDAGLDDLPQSDLKESLPKAKALFDELDARFTEARAVLGGEEPSRSCEEIPVVIDDATLAQLDHFRRAAVEVTRNELEQFDELVREIVDCARDIRGYQSETESTYTAEKDSRLFSAPFGLPVIDSDRVRGAAMVTLSMWVGYLLWIFVDPPGHLSWYQFVPNIALIAIQTPQAKPTLLKPFFFAYLAGLGAYVFIMPQLVTFWQLGILIFAFAFAAAYFLSPMGRVALFLALFNMLGIENQQTYDFASAANTFLFTMLALMVLFALAYVTRSARPEKAILNMVSRFFRSCEFLLSCLGAERMESKSWLDRYRRAWYLHELRSLPGKLHNWGRQIDPKKFPKATPGQIEDMIACFQVLVYRLEDLIETRQAPQAEVLVRELIEDVRAWRIVIVDGCRQFAKDPTPDFEGDLRDRLKTRLANLNRRIEETLNTVGDGEISQQERENFYRLLGSFRGFSEAALAYADSAVAIDWDQFREERF